MNRKRVFLVASILGSGMLVATCVLPLRVRDDYEHDWRAMTVDGIKFTAGAYATDIDKTGRWPSWPHRSSWGNPYTVVVNAVFNGRKDITSISIDGVFVNKKFELLRQSPNEPITHGDQVRATWESSFLSVATDLPYTDWELEVQMTWHAKNGAVLEKKVDLALPLEHRTSISNDLLSGLMSE